MDTDKQTKGVKTLLGDPKKAILKLSLPMVAAMSVNTLYNLADAIWVSGKGPEALSAVGFSFPFFFLAMAIANGIGIGGGSAISRRIGAKDKHGADSVATHTIVIMLVAIVIFTSGMLLLARPLISAMGAGHALELSLSYARIIFSGIGFVFFLQVAVSILRSEGDVKRAMYAMMAGAVLNIALDPILIYSLDMGVAGAAWATVFSRFVVSVVASYWLFVQRNTYVKFGFRRFRFVKKIMFDIARVGFPASVSQMSMSLMSFALTTIVASIAGPAGVAVYVTGWRVVSIASLPMLGVASAVTSVTGAAFGAKQFKKIKTSYLYSLKAGVLAEIFLAVIIMSFARQLSWIFAWSKESAAISDDLVVFLETISFMLPTVAFGMLSSAMFQGVGKGINALAMTIIRTLVFGVPFAWIFGVVLQGGLKGVWLGMVIAGLSYIPVAFGWSMMYIAKLKRTQKEFWV